MRIPWAKSIGKYSRHLGPRANEILTEEFLYINQRELDNLPAGEWLILDGIIKYVKEKPKKMNFALEALEIAKGELGKGEEGVNNAGPVVEKYLHGLAEPPNNWCAAFISWCFYTAVESMPSGFVMPFRYSLSARQIFNEFKKNEALVQTPDAGDLIFFWRESIDSWMGHIGIVEDLTDDGWLNTIEGNRGYFPSKVRRYAYQWPIPQLLGFGRVE
jgi:hypothetical protein